MSQNELSAVNKDALTSFILSIIGLGFTSSMVFCVPGLVLGIIGLAFSNRASGVAFLPYTIFKKFGRIASIINIVVSAIIITIAYIAGIVFAIISLVNNANLR